MSKWGSQGKFNGAFFRPTVIAVGNNTVFVGDSTGRSRYLIPTVSSLRNGGLWVFWSNNFLIYLELRCLRQPDLNSTNGSETEQIEEGNGIMIVPHISNPLFTQANQNGNSSIVFVTSPIMIESRNSFLMALLSENLELWVSWMVNSIVLMQ